LPFQRFKIYPIAHFDFNLNCCVFGYKKPMPEVYAITLWKRALKLGSGRLIGVELRSIGSTDEPVIKARHSQSLDQKDIEEVKEKLNWIFSFSQDLNDLYAFMDRDCVLKELKLRVYGLKAGKHWNNSF
jgi:hypothetical protein